MNNSTPKQLRGFVADLISLPSVSCLLPQLDMSNVEVVDYLSSRFSDIGFKPQKIALTGATDKCNMLASMGQGAGGLVLSGHTDTVPFNQSRWQSDPFSLTEKDGKWYGLGSCDMKAFFACVYLACSALDLRKLKKPLHIIATADEESAMTGAKELAENSGLRPEFAWIGEPTDLAPIRMHKGIMMQRMHIVGRSGHSSDPANGLSAISGLVDAVSSLERFRQHLAAKSRHSGFRIVDPTLNCGHVHGGDNPNRICGEVHLDFDLRSLPGQEIDEIKGELREQVGADLRARGFEVQFEDLFSGVSALETPADAKLVRLAEELAGVPAGAVNYATEGPFYRKMGAEVIVLGPGCIDQAHQPDEFVDPQQLIACTELLIRLIRRVCL